MKYLFLDLDNTLTETRQVISPEMSLALNRLKQQIIIVSGAELDRIKQQVPKTPKNTVYMTQNGNLTIQYNKILINNKLRNKEEIHKHIIRLCLDMNISLYYDSMVEDRGNQVSFSLIGHDKPLKEKKKFDPKRLIRTDLLDRLPFKNALIGGSTSIDYIPKTKGQNILKYIKDNKIKVSDCLYIGDALEGYGNDATVVGVIPTYQVKSPLETLNLIKEL